MQSQPTPAEQISQLELLQEKIRKAIASVKTWPDRVETKWEDRNTTHYWFSENRAYVESALSMLEWTSKTNLDYLVKDKADKVVSLKSDQETLQGHITALHAFLQKHKLTLPEDAAKTVRLFQDIVASTQAYGVERASLAVAAAPGTPLPGPFVSAFEERRPNSLGAAATNQARRTLRSEDPLELTKILSPKIIARAGAPKPAPVEVKAIEPKPVETTAGPSAEGTQATQAAPARTFDEIWPDPKAEKTPASVVTATETTTVTVETKTEVKVEPAVTPAAEPELEPVAEAAAQPAETTTVKTTAERVAAAVAEVEAVKPAHAPQPELPPSPEAAALRARTEEIFDFSKPAGGAPAPAVDVDAAEDLLRKYIATTQKVQTSDAEMPAPVVTPADHSEFDKLNALVEARLGDADTAEFTENDRTSKAPDFARDLLYSFVPAQFEDLLSRLQEVQPQAHILLDALNQKKSPDAPFELAVQAAQSLNIGEITSNAATLSEQLGGYQTLVDMYKTIMTDAEQYQLDKKHPAAQQALAKLTKVVEEFDVAVDMVNTKLEAQEAADFIINSAMSSAAELQRANGELTLENDLLEHNWRSLNLDEAEQVNLAYGFQAIGFMPQADRNVLFPAALNAVLSKAEGRQNPIDDIDQLELDRVTTSEKTVAYLRAHKDNLTMEQLMGLGNRLYNDLTLRPTGLEEAPAAQTELDDTAEVILPTVDDFIVRPQADLAPQATTIDEAREHALISLHNFDEQYLGALNSLRNGSHKTQEFDRIDLQLQETVGLIERALLQPHDPKDGRTIASLQSDLTMAIETHLKPLDEDLKNLQKKTRDDLIGNMINTAQGHFKRFLMDIQTYMEFQNAEFVQTVKELPEADRHLAILATAIKNYDAKIDEEIPDIAAQMLNDIYARNDGIRILAAIEALKPTDPRKVKKAAQKMFYWAHARNPESEVNEKNPNPSAAREFAQALNTFANVTATSAPVQKNEPNLVQPAAPKEEKPLGWLFDKQHQPVTAAPGVMPAVSRTPVRPAPTPAQVAAASAAQSPLVLGEAPAWLNRNQPAPKAPTPQAEGDNAVPAALTAESDQAEIEASLREMLGRNRQDALAPVVEAQNSQTAVAPASDTEQRVDDASLLAVRNALNLDDTSAPADGAQEQIVPTEDAQPQEQPAPVQTQAAARAPHSPRLLLLAQFNTFHANAKNALDLLEQINREKASQLSANLETVKQRLTQNILNKDYALSTSDMFLRFRNDVYRNIVSEMTPLMGEVQTALKKSQRRLRGNADHASVLLDVQDAYENMRASLDNFMIANTRSQSRIIHQELSNFSLSDEILNHSGVKVTKEQRDAVAKEIVYGAYKRPAVEKILNSMNIVRDAWNNPAAIRAKTSKEARAALQKHELDAFDAYEKIVLAAAEIHNPRVKSPGLKNKAQQRFNELLIAFEKGDFTPVSKPAPKANAAAERIEPKLDIAAKTAAPTMLQQDPDDANFKLPSFLTPKVGQPIKPTVAYQAGSGNKTAWGTAVVEAVFRRWPTISVAVGSAVYIKGTIAGTAAVVALGPVGAAIAIGATAAAISGLYLGHLNYHYNQAIDADTTYKSKTLAQIFKSQLRSGMVANAKTLKGLFTLENAGVAARSLVTGPKEIARIARDMRQQSSNAIANGTPLSFMQKWGIIGKGLKDSRDANVFIGIMTAGIFGGGAAYYADDIRSAVQSVTSPVADMVSEKASALMTLLRNQDVQNVVDAPAPEVKIPPMPSNTVISRPLEPTGIVGPNDFGMPKSFTDQVIAPPKVVKTLPIDPETNLPQVATPAPVIVPERVAPPAPVVVERATPPAPAPVERVTPPASIDSAPRVAPKPVVDPAPVAARPTLAQALAAVDTNTGKIKVLLESQDFQTIVKKLPAAQQAQFADIAKTGSFTRLNNLIDNISEGGRVTKNGFTPVRGMKPNAQIAAELRTVIKSNLTADSFTQPGFKQALALNNDHLAALNGEPSKVGTYIERHARKPVDIRPRANAPIQPAPMPAVQAAPPSVGQVSVDPLAAISKTFDEMGDGLKRFFTGASVPAAPATTVVDVLPPSPKTFAGKFGAAMHDYIVGQSGMTEQKYNVMLNGLKDKDPQTVAAFQGWVRTVRAPNGFTPEQVKLIRELNRMSTGTPPVLRPKR